MGDFGITFFFLLSSKEEFRYVSSILKQYLVCPLSRSLAFANLLIKDGCRGTKMQVYLRADISQVQRADCLAEFPVFLDVLSSWVMFPLKLTESICCNRCVDVNELSPEIWK